MIGMFFHFWAKPAQYLINAQIKINRSSVYAARGMDELFGGYSEPEWKDPYALDQDDITIRNISLGVGGVLLIVGFVIGSPQSKAPETVSSDN